MKKLTTLFVMMLAVVFATNAQSIISIDSARTNDPATGISVANGLTVQLTGVVYGPDAYPTSNGHQFMLRGATKSIKVYSKGRFQYSLTEGDSVTVVGVLNHYYGDAEVKLAYTHAGDTIIRLGAGTVAPPTVITTADLNSNGELYESSLVEIDNIDMAQLQNWPSSGTLSTVDHFSAKVGGLYFYVDSFMSPDFWVGGAPAAGIYNVVGFGSQYSTAAALNNGYSLQPRRRADFILQNVGVKDIANPLTASVYPNPAATKVTAAFNSDADGEYTVRMTDLTGRVALTQEGHVVNGDNALYINTASLSNGMYILELTAAGKNLITKINIAK